MQRSKGKFTHRVKKLTWLASSSFQDFIDRCMISQAFEENIRQQLWEKWAIKPVGYNFFEYQRDHACLVLKKYILPEDEAEIREWIAWYCKDGDLLAVTSETIARLQIAEFSFDKRGGTLYCDESTEWLIYITQIGIVIFMCEGLVDLVIALFMERQDQLNTLP